MIMFLMFSYDSVLILLQFPRCGAGSYSTHFQCAVHRAEGIRTEIGTGLPFVLGARFAAPLPIDYEFVFVVTRRQRQGDGPLAVRQVAVQWRGVWLPIVKSARDEYRLRLGGVAGQGNFVNVTLSL